VSDYRFDRANSPQVVGGIHCRYVVVVDGFALIERTRHGGERTMAFEDKEKAEKGAERARFAGYEDVQVYDKEER
jgi:hypothetical protein